MWIPGCLLCLLLHLHDALESQCLHCVCFQVDLRYLLRNTRCRRQCCPCLYRDCHNMHGLTTTHLRRHSTATSNTSKQMRSAVFSNSRNASESSSSGYHKATSHEIPAQVCKCDTFLVLTKNDNKNHNHITSQNDTTITTSQQVTSFSNTYTTNVTRS